MHSIDRFDARAVAWFLRVYGVALVVDVVTELAAGVWNVHTGHDYPWRHLGIVPLYPAGVLAVEWGLRAGAGLALLAGARRAKVVAAALRVLAVALFVAVLERYSNHGVLLFLVAFFLTLAPPDVTTADFDQRDHPALGLVRAQLVIVYVFSALNKVAHGFGSGRSLVYLLGGAISPGAGAVLSVIVIATELAIPVVLVRRPRAGIMLVVAMHATFALLVPGVLSFGIAMTALALLFADRTRATPALGEERVLRLARDAEDLAVAGLRELDGGEADAARRRVDEHAVAHRNSCDALADRVDHPRHFITNNTRQLRRIG